MKLGFDIKSHTDSIYKLEKRLDPVNPPYMEYYKSTSNTSPTMGSWSKTIPFWENGYFLWTRWVYTYTNGTLEMSDPVLDKTWSIMTDYEASKSWTKRFDELTNYGKVKGIVCDPISGALYFNADYINAGKIKSQYIDTQGLIIRENSQGYLEPVLVDDGTEGLRLSDVAKSGSYSDLDGKPNLSTVATSGKYSDLLNSPKLSTVATSGNYSDLNGKPDIDGNIKTALKGYIYADGTVGATPKDGATGFLVSSDGTLQASNAVIYGKVVASAGAIGGIYIYKNSIASQNGKFSVDENGYMYASNANISGTITGSIIKSSNSYWDDGNGHLLGRMVYLDNVTYANGGDNGSSNVSRGIGLFGAYGATADVGILGNDKNITDSNNWYTGLHLDLVSTTLRQPASQNCKVMLWQGNVKIQSNTGASIIVYDANNAEKINTIGMNGRVLISDYITFTHPNDKSWHSLSSIQHINNYLEIIVDSRTYGVSAWVSDKTLKRNISSTRINGSSILRNIEFKQFDWIDTGKHENIGVIAQDVEKIDGNLVLKIKQCDGTYSYQINPNEFATITAKALQEQMTRIDNMEININNKILQTKNDLLLENQKLKDKLSFLEEKVKYMNGEKSSYSE